MDLLSACEEWISLNMNNLMIYVDFIKLTYRDIANTKEIKVDEG